MPNHPNKRPVFWKQNLIINGAQIKLLCASIGFAILMAILSGCFSNFYISSHDSVSPLTMSLLVLTLFIVFALGCVWLTLYTQRVFGPIYRLHLHLRKRHGGETPGPIKIREDDYLQDLIDDYNRTLETPVKPAVDAIEQDVKQN